MHNPSDGFQIRFDGPPGPVSGRFVEVEDLDGRGVSIGEWYQDGEFWLLRVDPAPMTATQAENAVADAIGRGEVIRPID